MGELVAHDLRAADHALEHGFVKYRVGLDLAGEYPLLAVESFFDQVVVLEESADVRLRLEDTGYEALVERTDTPGPRFVLQEVAEAGALRDDRGRL